MSEQPKEALSALMDNEVGDFELRSLLKQSADNNELSGQWQRYHVASSLLKNEQLGSGDISAAVMDAIDAEPALKMDAVDTPANDGISGKSFFKPLISMAVAASVTAVVILGGQNFGINIDLCAVKIKADSVGMTAQPVILFIQCHLVCFV